jgi:hypothetical protein
LAQIGIDGMQTENKPSDYRSFGTTNGGFYYFLSAHKCAPLVMFGKNINGSETHQGYYLYIENETGKIMYKDGSREAKTISVPARLVLAKYNQTKHLFDKVEDLDKKLRSGKPVPDEEELTIQIDSHTIRLVNMLIESVANNPHVGNDKDNKLSLTILNTADNALFVPEAIKQSDSMKNGEWFSLKFNHSSYYLDPKEEQDIDDMLYYLAANKKANHIIFARAPSSKFKTTVVHHLYISQDDGLGRYKIQTNDGEIKTQFFVPVDYVVDRYNRVGIFMDSFKKAQDNLSSDVYYSQTIWYKLQEVAIYVINYTLTELEKDLKQKIEKSLHHSVYSVPMSNVNSFDDFYNRVTDREKKIRLESGLSTNPISLIIYSKHSDTTSKILVTKLEKDVFTISEKIRILISKYDSDYYVLVSEGWMPKSQEIQQRISSNYQFGDITKLLSHERAEILTFDAKIKNTVNREPDKYELYEIIRERPNDEKSRILELRKDNNIDPISTEAHLPEFS